MRVPLISGVEVWILDCSGCRECRQPGATELLSETANKRCHDMSFILYNAPQSTCSQRVRFVLAFPQKKPAVPAAINSVNWDRARVT